MKAIVDCNSFYAACERLFRPDLQQKPVVVLSNNDGCIVSRTDEAKALGIRMAGPYYEHKQEIEAHGVAVFSSNYHLYGDMSWRVMETLRRFAPSVEVYSVDECFLNLDGMAETNLYEYALFLKHITEEWTGIPVSIGVAPTKVLSKVANRLAKKDKLGTKGVLVLDSPETQQQALERTPVGDLWGVGGASVRKLELFNITNGWQLRNCSEEWARKNLGGVVGVRLIRELRGEPCIEMKDPLVTKKMIATTRMFGKPVFALNDLQEAVSTYITRAAEKLRRQHGAARMLSVFVVTNDYGNEYAYKPSTHARYTLLDSPTSLTHVLIAAAMPLLDQLYRSGSRYLKAGVTLAGIVPDESVQGNLFEAPAVREQQHLMHLIDNVNFSMRNDILQFARSGMNRHWKMRQELRSKRFTTRWEELFEVR
jgi:DNA polymerase V